MRLNASVVAIICLFASTVAFAQQRPASKPLQTFSFMGQDTEGVYGSSPIKPDCVVKPVGTSECTEFSDAKVAGQSMKWLSASYYNGKLYWIHASAGKFAFGDLLAAFTAKYGAPSSTKVEKWQAKSGATFDNTVVIWTFKGGRLQLDEMGLDINSCSFEFSSAENSPPPEKPKIDF